MKPSPEIDPAAAFPDSGHMPGESDLKHALGTAWPPIDEILARLHAAHPDVTSAWQFSRQSGWYQVQLLKKRRLLYHIPKRGDFRLMMILGRKAIARLQAGPFAARVTRLLKTAMRYPEGIAFTFDHASTDPDLLTAFLEAKISPEFRGMGLPTRVEQNVHGSGDPCHLPTKSR